MMDSRELSLDDFIVEVEVGPLQTHIVVFLPSETLQRIADILPMTNDIPPGGKSLHFDVPNGLWFWMQRNLESPLDHFKVETIACYAG